MYKNIGWILHKSSSGRVIIPSDFEYDGSKNLKNKINKQY